MAENSKIEWTHATLQRKGKLSASLLSSAPDFACMLFVVAVPAQRYAIRNIETQVRKLRKWLDMVGLQVAAPSIAAGLASESIPHKYVVAPPFEFFRVADSEPLSTLPIDIARRMDATGSFDSQCGTNLKSGVYIQALPQAMAVAFMDVSYFSFSLVGVPSSLEGRNSSLGNFAHLHTSAFVAHSIKAIISCPVVAEADNRTPSLAPSAAAFSRCELLKIVIVCHPGLNGGRFESPGFCLRHTGEYTGRN